MTYIIRLIHGERDMKKTQEPITYAKVQLSCHLAVKSLLEFQIWEKPGEHAKGTFRVRLDAEDEKGRKDIYEPLILWELAIDLWNPYAEIQRCHC